MTSANNFTPTNGKLSFSAVGQRSAGAGFVRFLAGVGSNNFLDSNNAVGQWVLNGGSSGTIIATASTGAYHAANAVLNGASSVLMIDGSDTTGTATGSTTAAAPNAGFPAVGSSYSGREAGFIDNYALSTAERTALDANMRAYSWP
jgi:hypothetical protein